MIKLHKEGSRKGAKVQSRLANQPMKIILRSNSVLSAILLLSMAHSLLVQAQTINAAETSVSSRVISSFDADWRFYKGDLKDGEKTDLDDSSWRKLDVPHDWSIEAPFDKDTPTDRAGRYLPA